MQQHARILAGKVLSDLQIKDPDEIEVEAIAAHYDCFIRDGGLRGADGRVCSNGRRAVIRIRADITDVGRRRYIIAHEFGHVRHKHESALAFCSDDDMVRYDDGGDARAEPEANAFAAELLMPMRMFKPRMGGQAPTLGLADELAPTFRTTFTATAIRMIDLASEPCAVVWSERGRIKWSVRSPDCYWFVPWGTELSSYTHASDVMRGRPLASGTQVVPADAWIQTTAGPDELLEESRWFRRLGATFSLLRER